MRDVTRGSLLDRLALAAELVATGSDRPGASTAGIGVGHMLAGHRPYRAGDDLRLLDPFATARLDRPVVRTTQREREERVHVLLDTSASMALGGPERWDRARELTLLLAALGLAGLGQVSVSLVGHRTETPWPAARGRAALGSLHAMLRRRIPSGGTRPATVASALRGRARGHAILITDFLDEHPDTEWADALSGPRPVWILVLRLAGDPLPDLAGDIELVDPETPQRQVLRLDRGSVGRARDRVRQRDLARATRLSEQGTRTVLLDAAQPWESLALGRLRTAGLLTGA